MILYDLYEKKTRHFKSKVAKYFPLQKGATVFLICF